MALVLFLVAGIAYAKDYEVKKKAGDYDVEIKSTRIRLLSEITI